MREPRILMGGVGDTRPMFPFESRWRWLFSTGYLHVVEAIREHTNEFREPYRQILEDRADRIKRTLRLRVAVILLLNLGIITTILAWAAQFFPALSGIRSLVNTVAGSFAGLSLVLTGVFLLITRYLGQLQADIISSMALGTPSGPILDEQARARLDELEAKAQRRGWFPDAGEEPSEGKDA